MACESFRPELFTEPREYEETPLRDRKQKFPNLKHNETKAEFIRDIIAMANTARLWGKPAYLLFGLDDQGKLCDIWAGLRPNRLSEPTPGDDDSLRLAKEQMNHKIGEIASYIAPSSSLLCQFQLGWVEGMLVGYLCIEPSCPEKAFHIARDLTSGGKPLLQQGSCWIRSGESKMEVDRREIDLNFPGYRQVPFVAPSMWLRYFEALRTEREIDQAARKEPYLDIYDLKGIPLTEVIQKWLEEGRKPILIIAGPPGSGKSTLLCRIVAEWADEGIKAMEAIRQREEFYSPPDWIPVYFRLKGAQIRDADNLAKEILDRVKSVGRWWTSEPSAPERLLSEEKLRWLICLDGLDELWEDRKIDKFLESVQALCRKYPRLKVLISTRPETSIPGDLECIHIAKISADRMLTYLQVFVNEENEPFYRQLEEGFSRPESELYLLKEICTVPLYLETLASLIAPETAVQTAEPLSELAPPDAVQDWESASIEGVLQPRPVRLEELVVDPSSITESEAGSAEERGQISGDWSATSAPEKEMGPPLTLGWVLDRMVRRVWEREASRRSIERLTLYGWWKATGELSMQMDGHRQFVEIAAAKRCYSSNRGLRWVLNLAILNVSKRGIGFSHPCFQHYFGADYLRDDAGLRNRWMKQCTPDFWQSVMTILNQIQYSEVSYDATGERSHL